MGPVLEPSPIEGEVKLMTLSVPKFPLHQFHQCLQDPYRKIDQASGIH